MREISNSPNEAQNPLICGCSGSCRRRIPVWACAFLVFAIRTMCWARHSQWCLTHFEETHVEPGFQQLSPLRGLSCCWRVFEFGNEFLETGVRAKAFQIIVGGQSIGIFIPALDGFAQILESVVEMVRSDGGTRERIPHRETVS